VYVLGGLDASGTATTTAWAMTPDTATGALTAWEPAADALTLPEARAGASVVALADGLLLIGGVDAQGAPVRSVWKSTLDEGELGAWAPQTDLPEPRADAEAAVSGTYVFVFGGRDGSGPTATVLRGHLPAAADAEEEPGAEPAATQIAWAAGTGTSNLPAPRTDAAGFLANGGLYLIGGSDGTNVHNELYWAIPDATGNIPEWKHLDQSDLPEPGLAGSAAVVSGANAFLVGGRTADGVITGAARTNLAPQPPFFQLGLFGATIPALKIEGEVGQQLGYLAAAGVSTGNFVLLIIIGWAYAHPQRTRELIARFRNRGRRGS
jgi:hypothetical protein